MKQDSDIKNDNKTFLANLRKILIIGSLLIVAMIAIIFLNVGVVIFFIGLILGEWTQYVKLGIFSLIILLIYIDFTYGFLNLSNNGLGS